MVEDNCKKTLLHNLNVQFKFDYVMRTSQSKKYKTPDNV